MSETSTVKIGKRVPNLSGKTDSDTTLALKSLREKWLVIYFYPRDATPGCTTEAGDFRDLHSRFRKHNCEILGVSRDSVASHARFRAKQELPFQLIADVDETWCKAFDVIHEKVLYGKRHLGIVRSTFLIDPQGILRAEWRKVKVPGHAAAVLEQLTAE
ncbi:MAG TPA: peroxiredoxin [Dokdonella sp.]|uniref:peroxiredoxin n=1 Tax=Dokdonella sp. TaxID=2291710 RepID=UPI002D80D591|nr:peroxiredoxin [Dokdonella sp.]HET9033440.1 peroxiredoxin [Dokdonella sp.]